MPKGRKNSSRGKALQYDWTNLPKAMTAVGLGGMSFRKAEVHFNVPKSTLHDRVKERFNEDAHPGRKPTLPEVIEDKIVESVKEASRQASAVSNSWSERRISAGDTKKATPSKQ